MAFDPHIADIRFGCGLSVVATPPGSVSEMLQRLAGPDTMAAELPIPGWPEYQKRLVLFDEALSRRIKAGTDMTRRRQATADLKVLRRDAARDEKAWLGLTMQRRAVTSDGFRERLAFFWADHFTTIGRSAPFRRGASAFAETAIRPHLNGRFEDMLISVMEQPMMLQALDQQNSVGPDSILGQQRAARGQTSGVNENLARELMELHTLGADGPYTQQDVQQLARLLSGLTFQLDDGFRFAPNFSEPGTKTVLGKAYGADAMPGQLSDVQEVLRDLARHPATAAHLSRKLAVHFVSDTPSESLVTEMAGRYRETGGDLSQVYAAMLEHPDAWKDPLKGNVKLPIDFLGSAYRLLVPHMEGDASLQPGKVNRWIKRPLVLMGQDWKMPIGPDGWAEEDADWINAQRYAARLQWAVNVPRRLIGDLPDPRDLLVEALGPLAPAVLTDAVAAAQTRPEGVVLLLASPQFQRM